MNEPTKACKHGPDATYDADGHCTKCGANLFPPTQCKNCGEPHPDNQCIA